MALESFKPSLWAGALLKNLHKSLVYGQAGIIGREYEGEIREMGDSVRITNIGPVTVLDYTANSDLTAAETLTEAQRVLLIDQSKAFNFLIDDIDAAQVRSSVMEEAMREAGYALANTADQFIAALYTDAGTFVDSDASPFVPDLTTNLVYNKLVDLGTKLDENNVPAEGRFVVVPPWVYAFLLKDSRFTDASAFGQSGVLQNGEVGRAAGFRILKSNNVPNTTSNDYKVIAGHPMAWSYAEQISKVEGYRPEARFADAVKGLHVYGAKVVRPEALVVCTMDES